MEAYKTISDICRAFYPDVQAIYLFGTFGTEYERPESDIDIAVLLPAQTAKNVKSFSFSPCEYALIEALHKSVDLINLRIMPTVFQNEIIGDSRLIFCADERAKDEFEMLSLSFYQKLNDERAGILKQIFETGRILQGA